MSDEFKEFDVTPTLTFEVEEEKPAPKEPEKPTDPNMTEDVLSVEERQMVESFSKQIDIRNSAAILQYGVGTQKKMADFSEEALAKVTTKDLGEVGDLLENVVKELKSFDAVEEEKGLFGIFKRGTNKIQALKTKYAKAEGNIEQIVQTLEKHQIQLLKDSATMDKMYALNLNYFKELSMYILAGKKKLQEVREGELKELTLKAQMSNLPEDAQGNAYTMVSTWKLQKDVKKINTKAVIGLYTGVYMTENNLYLSTTLYADIAQQEKNDSSRILRFKLDGGKLVENKTVVMPGSFANSFAIQERKDMLYVVTEIIRYAYEQDAKGEEGYESGQNYVSNTEICAYVFDDALEMISKCGNIAENEDVKAVRLLEDVGYVVSYQQTDPLISIDFSDPKELKVMDELKMPGFSTYLHPVKDNLLLGIGTTDDTQNQHIKIALYDISDNENLHIFDEKLIEDMENSNVEYDYKGVFIDGDNSIVGFGGMTYDEKYLDDPEEKAYRNTYVLYRYSREGKLEPIGDYEVKTGSSGTVGMRIGSWFYIIPYGHADVSDMVIVPYL